MSPSSHLSDQELLASLPSVRAAERKATAELIARLAEVDRRRLYLVEACSSLHAFCVERLRYSENEAQKRIVVSRLYQRVPRVLTELESGSMHLTGLFLISGHLTENNAEALLADVRGQTRRQIEATLARWFPRSDVLPSITPLVDAVAAIPGNSDTSKPRIDITPDSSTASPKSLVEPLSASSYRVEFTASAALHGKIEQARNLLGHVLPSGDLSQLLDRALDALIEAEMKRRMGVAKQRRRRELKPGSRHIPVQVARAVWQRDSSQCTFVDEQGRRCAEGRFLTIEHRKPFALGGPATTDNLCLLCAPHNALRARDEFGEAYIQGKQLEAQAHAKTLSALVRMGFERRKARSVLEELRRGGASAELEPLLRAALASLVS